MTMSSEKADAKQQLALLQEQVAAGMLGTAAYLRMSSDIMKESCCGITHMLSHTEDVVLQGSTCAHEDSTKDAETTSPLDTTLESIDEGSEADTEDADGEDAAPVDLEEEKAIAARAAAASAFIQRFRPSGAACARKRKKPAPPAGARPSKMKQGSRRNDVSTATLRKRPSEFPNEGLEVRSGQLFCTNCNENTCSAVDSIKKHCKSDKHRKGKEDKEKHSANLTQIQAALEDFVDNCAMEGEDAGNVVKVCEKTQLYRAETLEEFLKAGVAVDKIDRLREYLERHAGHRLTTSGHLKKDYLGPLALKEMALIRKELKGQLVHVAWYDDETTHDGESFCSIARVVTDDLDILLRAVRVKWFSSTLNANEISSVRMSVITEDAQLPLMDSVAFMHDSVAANIASFRDTVGILCPYADDEPCAPHTGNHVGEAINHSTLDDYMALYNQAMAHSNYAKIYWRECCIGKVERKCKTRWWPEHEVHGALLDNLENGNLLQWAEALIKNEQCEKTAGKMKEFLVSPRKFTLLWLELAVAVHCGGQLMAGFTTLEGDGFEYLTAYDTLMDLGVTLKTPISKALQDEIRKIAAQAPSSPASQVPVAAPPPTVEGTKTDDRLRAMLSCAIKDMNVSILSPFWDWDSPPEKETLTLTPTSTLTNLFEH